MLWPYNSGEKYALIQIINKVDLLLPPGLQQTYLSIHIQSYNIIYT